MWWPPEGSRTRKVGSVYSRPAQSTAEFVDYQRNYRGMQEEQTWGILRGIAHFLVPQTF